MSAGGYQVDTSRIDEAAVDYHAHGRAVTGYLDDFQSGSAPADGASDNLAEALGLDAYRSGTADDLGRLYTGLTDAARALSRTADNYRSADSASSTRSGGHG